MTTRGLATTLLVESKPRRRLRDRLMFKKEPEYYYHQIFFHYVLANGSRVQCAGDPK